MRKFFVTPIHPTSVMKLIFFFFFFRICKGENNIPQFINLKIGLQKIRLQKLNYLTDEGRITGYSADVN